MTNREHLSSLNSSELAKWLEAEEEVKTITINSSTTNWDLFPNFKPIEFTCPCGKCQYSTAEGVANMDASLLTILQTLRNKFGIVTITCGARCQEYNDSIKGSVKNSAHIRLKAADVYIRSKTSTEAGREEVLGFAKLIPGYSYGYHNKNGSNPNMGSAVHIEVK